MKILAVETATEACSAALYVDGDILERYEIAPREHSRLILPMMDSLLNESGISLNQLDALAFGRGPGSFTGLRIAAGVIQGSAFGADLPVVPISSLAAMAQDEFSRSEITVAFCALDARMEEIYWGVYESNVEGIAQLIGSEAVVKANSVSFPNHMQGVGIGSGWKTYEQKLVSRLGKQVQHIEAARFPRASAVAVLGAIGFQTGQCVPPDRALPIYLRDNVVKKKC